MTSDDPVVKLAKLVSKDTKVPLPRVAQIFQKHPLTRKGVDAAIEEVWVVKKQLLMKDLSSAFNLKEVGRLSR